MRHGFRKKEREKITQALRPVMFGTCTRFLDILDIPDVPSVWDVASLVYLNPKTPHTVQIFRIFWISVMFETCTRILGILDVPRVWDVALPVCLKAKTSARGANISDSLDICDV